MNFPSALAVVAGFVVVMLFLRDSGHARGPGATMAFNVALVILAISILALIFGYDPSTRQVSNY